jgi:RNA polymerase sigma factor (sigma-70 family)
MTDEQLLAEFAARSSERAFGELVGAHTGMVHSVCLRVLGDQHAAEDATQAVFMVLARKARSWPRGASVAGWLFRTAELTARSARKIAARRARHEKEAAMSRQSAAAPAATWEKLRPELDAALTALPVGQQDAVVLRYFRGLTESQVAEELGVSQPAVAIRLKTALERLRGVLERRGVAVPAAALGGMLAGNAVSPAPAALVAAVQTVCLGKAAASQAALALAEGTMKTIFWLKVKVVAAVLLGATVIGGGGGTLAVKLAAGEPAKPSNATLAAMPENTWVKLTPNRNPVGRSYSGVCYGGGQLFYFGGGHGSHAGNDVELYDVAANTWTQATELEDWRDWEKWTHAPKEQLASVKNIGGGSNATGVTSPKGRPLTLHTYQMHAWVPEEKLFYNMVRGLGMWTFDPAKREWKEVSKSLPAMGDVHTGGLLYDPELKNLVAIISGGGDNGVHLWDREKKSWARKADCPDRSWSEVYSAYDPARKLHVIRSAKRGMWWTLDTSTWKTKTIASLDHGESTSVDYDPETKSVLCLKKANTAAAGAPIEVWAYDAEKDAWAEVKLAGTAPAGICAWGLLNYDPEHKCHLLLNLLSVGGGMTGGRTDGVFAFRLRGAP